jgi:2-dehydropantoate 2-reductase
VRAEVPADITKALWEKFLLVSSFGGIGAVSRAPIGVIRSVPRTRRLLEACIGEAVSVGRAHGVALADTALADTLALLDALPAAATTSLQRDIGVGRPSELEAWTGAVVRLAQARGVPAPLQECIYAGLLPLELRARGDIEFPG